MNYIPSVQYYIVIKNDFEWNDMGIYSGYNSKKIGRKVYLLYDINMLFLRHHILLNILTQ